ncbi:MAG: PEP-CTERM sorting domain-containing protein, partial [Myxococcales bacterium]|nr:PEP-CTERM sorting domain-containing protein [Myxococcales bacterium]
MRVVSLILGIVCLGFAFNASAKPLFMGLGDLPGGDFYSKAFAVSADGSVVVGMSDNACNGAIQLLPGSCAYTAFRWTEEGGMVGLGDLPGGYFGSGAYAVSADGSVVVGEGISASSTPGYEAFQWTQGSGMLGLGDLPGGGFYSKALAVSASGAVVVGGSHSASGPEAFRRYSVVNLGDGLTYTFTVGLGDLPGWLFSSSALGVSADGSVVVGSSASASGWEAFRWTQGGGMVGLGDLPGGTFYSGARAVSADGSVVVGWAVSASGHEAFRWTQ